MIRVLIADDHAIVRRGLRQLLLEEYPSARIEEVGDAESLISKALQDEWDVVICDLSMPGRSGLDALRQIRQSSPSLPVLIMSMHPEDQYALRVLKAGASGYLNKESIHEEVIKAVQFLMNARARNEAMKRMDQGDYEGARFIIGSSLDATRAACADFASAPAVMDECASLEETARSLTDRLKDRMSRKRLAYAAYSRRTGK